MKFKTLLVLVLAAAGLAYLAYYMGAGPKKRAASAVGKKVMAEYNGDALARIEVGDGLVIAADKDGSWKIKTMQDYPADVAKVRDNLMKLNDLKVGNTARGKTIEKKTRVSLKDDSGKELASVTLGEPHENWSLGRYVEFDGQPVLVSDRLDAFDGDPKKWCETKIVDDPWISFNSLADASLKDDVLGFSTGVVAKVTIAGDTNRVATVGNVVKGGSDRYLKLDNSKWVYVVPSYSVDKLLPKPPPKEEEKKDEAKPAVPAVPAAKPAPAAKPVAKPAAPAKPVAAPAAKPATPAPAAKPAAVPAPKPAVATKPVEVKKPAAPAAPAAKPAPAAKLAAPAPAAKPAAAPAPVTSAPAGKPASTTPPKAKEKP